MNTYSVSLPNAMADVQIAGRVTRDVEMRFTPEGTKVANVNLAVSRRWLPKDSEEWKEQTSFLSVAVWGDAAERTSNLHKGDVALASFSVADLKAEIFTGNDGESKTSLKVGRAQVSRIAWANGEHADAPVEETEAPADEPITF